MVKNMDQNDWGSLKMGKECQIHQTYLPTLYSCPFTHRSPYVSWPWSGNTYHHMGYFYLAPLIWGQLSSTCSRDLWHMTSMDLTKIRHSMAFNRCPFIMFIEGTWHAFCMVFHVRVVRNPSHMENHTKCIFSYTGTLQFNQSKYTAKLQIMKTMWDGFISQLFSTWSEVCENSSKFSRVAWRPKWDPKISTTKIERGAKKIQILWT